MQDTVAGGLSAVAIVIGVAIFVVCVIWFILPLILISQLGAIRKELRQLNQTASITSYQIEKLPYTTARTPPKPENEVMQGHTAAQIS